MYLYLDSTQHIVCGIYDDNTKSWVSYKELHNKKGSKLMHGLTFELLSEQNLKIDDIEGLILASGPGSYTGMRLAEGFAQILEWRNVPVRSFYHFEVPGFHGVKEGLWVASAFKGEYFYYQWPRQEGDPPLSENLMSREAFHTWMKQAREKFGANAKEQIFCHLKNIFEQEDFIPDSTFELIRTRAGEFFTHILQRGKRLEPFYYRPLEKEFTIPKGL